MRIQVDLRRPRWLRRPVTWKGRTAVLSVALLTVAVPVAWASHDFGDVPTGHPFHAQISAIKGAGITTGCGGGNYCPSDNVSREAMAAFMHRGYGRVTQDNWDIIVPAAEIAGTVTTTITTGVASGTVGTNGFVKSDAAVQVLSDCDSVYRAMLVLQGYGYMDAWGGWQSIPAGTYGDLSLSAAAPAGPGVKTIEVRIWGGCGGAQSVGNVTTSYFPFGGTGGNALGSQANRIGSDRRFGPGDKSGSP